MKTSPNFRDLERIHGVTWQELTELEPKLGELLWGARHACVTCRRWSDVSQAFAPIRNTLAELVGSAAKNSPHPVLGRRGAYQVAYWKLYDAVAGLWLGHAAGAAEALEKREATVAETCSAESATANPSRRRFDRTLGFWLGAIALGTAGCILGARMAYPHPVAVTLSVLWWGIFLGCFGGSIGALLGLWAEQTPASPFQGSEVAGESPSRADSARRRPLADRHHGSGGFRATNPLLAAWSSDER